MMMKEKSFAEIIYRLPGKSTCVRLSSASAPVPLMSCEELGRRHGFVFAPFKPSSSHPVWLVVPDKTEVFPQDSLALSCPSITSPLCPLVPTSVKYMPWILPTSMHIFFRANMIRWFLPDVHTCVWKESRKIPVLWRDNSLHGLAGCIPDSLSHW